MVSSLKNSMNPPVYTPVTKATLYSTMFLAALEFVV